MAEEGTSPEELQNQAAHTEEHVEETLDTVSDALPPIERPISGLDQEEFEAPSTRYLGLFGAVGALVGLAIGIQQGNAAFGMAVGLALGVGLGLLLNTYTGR